MRDLTTAMFEKYDSGPGNEQYSFIHCKPLGSKSDSTDKKPVKLLLPSLLTLDNEQISTVGDISVVDELFRGIKELDLTKNLITDWKEVITLLKHMKNLEFMNLTMNLLDDSTLEDDLTCKFELKTLVLNGTGISWPTIGRLLQFFPNLQELHISLNGYKTVDLPPDYKYKGRSLTKVYMNRSEIDNWDEINKLGRAFPFLQTLNLISSNLSTICDSIPLRKIFPGLLILNLSQSKLQSWEEIDKLVRIENLRITEVPFLDQHEAKERRQHLISRLPHLLMLNGSPVTDSERDTAERAFLRYFMDHNEKPAIYDVLKEKHGQLDKLAEVDLSAGDPDSANDIINLLIIFDDCMEYMDVDRTQSTAEFKKMLQNFTGLPPTETIVYFIEKLEGLVLHVHHLRTPGRKLFTYKMNKGDQFVIERRPPPQK